MTRKRPIVSDVLSDADAKLAFRVSLATVRGFGLRGHDAEDAAAKAVLNATRSWEEFVEDDAAGSRERWLATIASNVARDSSRRARTRAVTEPMVQVIQRELHLGSRPLKPETVALNTAARAARRRLFESLPPRLAAAIPVVACQVAGELSREAAANLLGLSVHSYDKAASNVKAALKAAVADSSVNIEELFEIDQAREGRGR